MKFAINFFLFIISYDVFSQEVMIAEKAMLGLLPNGDGNGQVSYYSNEEGFYSPGSPTVDGDGRLWFFPSTKNAVIVFMNGAFSERSYPNHYPKTQGPNAFPIASQLGVFGYYSGNPYDLIFDWRKSKGIDYRNIYNEISYPIPNGFIVEWRNASKNTRFVVSIERAPNKFSMIEDLKGKFTFRDMEQTRAWLPTQPGGFSIGDDGLLYRNGMVWSAILPEGRDGARYLGKLASGHNIWASSSGNYGMESWFYLSNSLGEIELQLVFPWARAEKFEERQFHNYGVGPFGEFYCLLTPKLVPGLRWPKGSSAELVVVRNHLKYFGRLNDGGVRLRKEPNTSSEILGTYPAKTGFRIIERNGKEETIAGQKSDWVKVRLLDGKEGWFFGAFVHNLYDGPNGKPPPWPNVPDW